MNAIITYRIGVALAGLGVAIGAFGAHALRPVLELHARTETFELAVRYQFYHAFAILFCGFLMQHSGARYVKQAVFCFIGGTLIFSGSLYALSLSGKTVLGAITPVGGVLFLTGWILVFLGLNKKSLG